MSQKTKKNSVRCAEDINAQDYLNKVCQFILETEKDHMAWKWVLLSLYSALYGFTLLACRGQDQEGVIWKGRGKTKSLIPLSKAIELCQDTMWMNMILHSKSLELTGSQNESIAQLRMAIEENPGFFAPEDWKLDIEPLPAVVSDVLEVISFLALETKIPQVLKSTQLKTIKSTLNKCKKFLKARST